MSASHGDTEYGWLVVDVSQSLRFDYEEGDPKDAEASLAQLMEAAKAKLTFCDLADAIPEAVKRLRDEPADGEDDSDLIFDQEFADLVDTIENVGVDGALGLNGPRPK